MKLFVVHDAKGLVKSAGVSGVGFAGQLHLIPQKGQKVSEIDVPEAQMQATLETIDQEVGARNLLDLIEHHRVDLKGDVPRLVPKRKARR
jgi:hypothetical protein